MPNIVKRLAFNISMIAKGRRSLAQSFNLFKYRMSARKTRLNYKPIMLSILSIHRCNLACRMCLTHSKELGEHRYRHKFFPDMTFDMFKDINSHFPEAIAVGFVGNGEPLLNKDIFRMIDHAENLKKRTFLISNGMVLHDYIDRILDSRLSEIDISINSDSADDYERLTAMPSKNFGIICSASRELIERKRSKSKDLLISGSFIIDRTNLSNIQQMIDLAQQIGFDMASFYNILPLTKERAKKISLYDDEETLGILRGIKLPQGEMKVNLPIPLDNNMEHNNICDDFFTSINIDGNGNVGGCNRQRFDVINNGKYYDPDVWNNPYFIREREKFLNLSYQLEEPCLVCFANSTYIKRIIR
jgi:MoaA/NifB/PqqE/SkfB family radical SAM enzyme